MRASTNARSFTLLLRAVALGVVVALVWFIAKKDASSVAHAADSPPPPFAIIVNSQNPVRIADRRFVADAFLKKVTRWPNGDVIKPVDLPADSGARERFSQEVLKRSVAAVKSYWQQVIFSGRDVPPPELLSDESVVKYVETHPTAIGYVSGSTPRGDTTVLELR